MRGTVTLITPLSVRLLRESSVRLFVQFRILCALLAWTAVRAFAQAEEPLPNTPPEKPIERQRVLGVLPNYRTTDGTQHFARISAGRKLYIARRDSFDYPVFVLSGMFAAIYQAENQNPSYGQGLRGYGKRYGAAYADQALGNMMTEGIVPTLLKQDPRYFRVGSGGGSGWRRTRYALTRVFVGRNDKGAWTFNYPEWVGLSATVAISNLYYPSDTRNARDNAQKLAIQVATDAFSNVLKEFWPDWKRTHARHK